MLTVGLTLRRQRETNSEHPPDLTSLLCFIIHATARLLAPIAPDRRSFLSVNSSQVRLHLSAWYDGGCEIDKFIVQYKIRGQQEWTLVSNNILREQLSVVIRDLAPATGYELLVGAQNQVGLTEVKYRFITLDPDGKQVPAIEANSQFASSSSDVDSDTAIDYSDSGADGTRREFSGDPHSGQTMTRSLLAVRQFMSSPLALVISLCFFVVLLMVLIFYKINGQANGQSSPSISGLNLSSNNNNNNKLSGGRNSGGEPNMVAIMNDNEIIGAHSVANTSGSGCTDSPVTRMSTLQQQHSIRLLNATQGNSNTYSPVPESCHYQPFCNPVVQQQQQQINDYSHYGLPVSTYEPLGGNIYSALPQPGATMDQVSQSSASMMLADQDRSRQLIQMLMLQGQQQQSQVS